MRLPKIYMECQFKAVGDAMTFTAYGNTKHVIDHVGDVAVDGCYTKSIDRMKAEQRFSRLFWGHNQRDMPVGTINHMEEDTKGLLFSGKLSKTTAGNDLYILAKDRAVDRFSIGYNVEKEEFDHAKGINYLQEIDIKEISFVNFACNEDSVMVDIKSLMLKGALPTVREMEKLLRASGLSRKEAETVSSFYNPKVKDELDIEALKSHPMFK